MPRYTPNSPRMMNVHSITTGEMASRWISCRSMYSLNLKKPKCAEYKRRPKPSRKSAPPAIASNSQRLTFMPGVSQRNERNNALPFFPFLPLDISELHKRAHVPAAQVRGELVGEEHGAMPPSGAADGDGHMRFALALETRHQ